MDELKPCQFRQVDNHGRILCNVIKGGDREVSVNLCRACPVSQINCQNLRAGLEKKVSTPITVRFATGRVEVWDDLPASVEFKQAACAAKTMPIHSPRDCAGCPIRVPNVIPQNAIQVAHRAKPTTAAATQNTTVAQAVVPQLAQVQGTPAAQPMAQAVTLLAAQQSVVQSPTAKQAIPQTPRPVVARVQAQAAPAGIDVGAANDLITRAKATAARKAEEKRQREIEQLAQEQARQQELERIALEQAQRLELERVALEEKTKYNAVSTSETKPKIIQMKEWLKEQATKKQKANAPSPYKPQALTPDVDGVSDIVYSPLGAQTAMAYQETIDYERCVGWTD